MASAPAAVSAGWLAVPGVSCWGSAYVFSATSARSARGVGCHNFRSHGNRNSRRRSLRGRTAEIGPDHCLPVPQGDSPTYAAVEGLAFAVHADRAFEVGSDEERSAPTWEVQYRATVGRAGLQRSGGQGDIWQGRRCRPRLPLGLKVGAALPHIDFHPCRLHQSKASTMLASVSSLCSYSKITSALDRLMNGLALFQQVVLAVVADTP